MYIERTSITTIRTRKANVEGAAAVARPPKRITISIGGRTQSTTPGRFKNRIIESVKVLEKQDVSSFITIANEEEEIAAMAELGRPDCRAAPPRRALSGDAKARAQAKRKAAYVNVDVPARFGWTNFELPNPIKLFGKDDVWIGNQAGSTYKLVEPKLLNVRNNVDHFARDKQYSVRSKADRVILKRAQELAPQATMSTSGTQSTATNTIDGHQQLRDMLDAQDGGGVVPHTQPSTSHQVRPQYSNSSRACRTEIYIVSERAYMHGYSSR